MKLTKTIALAGLLLASAAGSAATIWEPTDVVADGNVNFIQLPGFGLSLNGGSLALFEDTDALMSNPLVLGQNGGIFAFTDIGGGSFNVEAVVGGISQGSIVINGYEFMLGVNWGAGYVGDSGYTQDNADQTTYVIDFTGAGVAGSTLAVDLTPVPLPAAAWLFGSALLGLTVVKRRKS